VKCSQPAPPAGDRPLVVHDPVEKDTRRCRSAFRGSWEPGEVMDTFGCRVLAVPVKK
jgi:hypothetical protein